VNSQTLAKLKILAAAAKYDVSCSSSGVSRKGAGGPGNACGWGICHSFAADGRCISLLKILLSNHCRYACAYCVNRADNDIPRAAFDSAELAELTLEFYRRNYIEGLFLSSGVVKSPDCTMERMLRVLELLREKHRFSGYIHMKCIPGASRELVRRAGRYADRLSVNIEIPSEANLKRLAPDKDYSGVYAPMNFIRQETEQRAEDRRKYASVPDFAPAGQSTQVIIGASDERDKDILRLSSLLYRGPRLKRVYYSAFVPVGGSDPRLPALSAPPLRRENRLYQADWLLRFYHFEAHEIADAEHPDLDLEVDPKIAWALRHPEFFPLDVNRADYPALLRVPGIGPESARRIIYARRCRRLGPEHLSRLGVLAGRARFFIVPALDRTPDINRLGPGRVRALLLAPPSAAKASARQLSLLRSSGNGLSA
jgi:putative DNA modification/repair radical SAM protein